MQFPRLVSLVAFASLVVLVCGIVAAIEPATDGGEAEPSADAASLQQNTDAKHSTSNRREVLVASLTIFVLAVFVGFEVIAKVPTTLHTPLMSGSNAISGITVVGALIAASEHWEKLPSMAFTAGLGVIAIVLAMINVVGGFLVTHRMLAMFQRKKKSP